MAPLVVPPAPVVAKVHNHTVLLKVLRVVGRALLEPPVAVACGVQGCSVFPDKAMFYKLIVEAYPKSVSVGGTSYMFSHLGAILVSKHNM